jgi:rhamnose utilization protein RhaD (predicted bifunctional aldolase and dehydrogenase)
LIALARAAAEPHRDLVILAEGNAAAKDGADSFWVKVTGETMRDIGAHGFVRVQTKPLTELVESDHHRSDREVREVLNAAVITEETGQAPSTEAFVHAVLFQREGAQYALHTHPTAIIAVSCLADAEEFCHGRLFPDHVVLCGTSTCFVPYVPPGLPLARALRSALQRAEGAHVIKTAMFQNHGLVSWGATPAEALDATETMVKAARAYLLARAASAVRFLSPEEVAHIADWPDEHARQAKLRQRPVA